MSELNAKFECCGLAEYGRKLERLGKMFQDENTNLETLFKECYALGLILAFRVSPDPRQSIDMEVDLDGGAKGQQEIKVVDEPPRFSRRRRRG